MVSLLNFDGLNINNNYASSNPKSSENVCFAFNKGTGAGGANTNKNGKKFEELTNNEVRLLSQGFTKNIMNKNKYGYYLSKKIKNIEIIFVLQGGLVDYMKKEYDIELFRHPDEEYII